MVLSQSNQVISAIALIGFSLYMFIFLQRKMKLGGIYRGVQLARNIIAKILMLIVPVGISFYLMNIQSSGMNLIQELMFTLGIWLNTLLNGIFVQLIIGAGKAAKDFPKDQVDKLHSYTIGIMVFWGISLVGISIIGIISKDLITTLGISFLGVILGVLQRRIMIQTATEINDDNEKVRKAVLGLDL